MSAGRTVVVGALLVAVVASAIAVVYLQHQRRSLFVTLQRLERERDAMDVEWGRLRLEEGVWSAHERLERVARDRLGLAPPRPRDIVLVLP